LRLRERAARAATGDCPCFTASRFRTAQKAADERSVIADGGTTDKAAYKPMSEPASETRRK